MMLHSLCHDTKSCQVYGLSDQSVPASSIGLRTKQDARLNSMNLRDSAQVLTSSEVGRSLIYKLRHHILTVKQIDLICSVIKLASTYSYLSINLDRSSMLPCQRPIPQLSGGADKLSLNLSQGALLCLHHCEPHKHHSHCIDDLHSHTPL